MLSSRLILISANDGSFQVFTEHESVERSRRLQTEPIDLYECFKAFTKEEELGEDELW